MRKIYTVIVLLTVVAVASCGPGARDPQEEPVSSDKTPVLTPTVDSGKFVLGESAIVRRAEAVFLESFPLQVHIQIEGDLPDGCTSVYRTDSELREDTFVVKVITLRERDAICTQALQPFEASAPLDVYGLPAGTYQVEVNGLSTQFTFTQDNTP